MPDFAFPPPQNNAPTQQSPQQGIADAKAKAQAQNTSEIQNVVKLLPATQL